MEHSNAFNDGFDAYLVGLSLNDNPYFSDQSDWWDWIDGWYAAAEDD